MWTWRLWTKTTTPFIIYHPVTAPHHRITPSWCLIFIFKVQLKLLGVFCSDTPQQNIWHVSQTCCPLHSLMFVFHFSNVRRISPRSQRWAFTIQRHANFLLTFKKSNSRKYTHGTNVMSPHRPLWVCIFARTVCVIWKTLASRLCYVCVCVC